MNTWNVILTDDAQNDIRSIYDCIAKSLLVPDIASQQVKRILDSIRSLETMPLRHPLYEKEPWRTRGLRSDNI